MLCFTSCGYTLTDKNISFSFIIQNVLIHDYSRYTTTFYTSIVHGSVHRNNILIHIQQDATLHSLFIGKLFCMFRVVLPPIIRNANNCIYSIWYLSHCMSCAKEV